MQNNETEVMDKEEVKFTDVQVLSALGKLDPEVRRLLMETIKIDKIYRFCNDEEFMSFIVNLYNRYLDDYHKVGTGIVELKRILDNAQSEGNEQNG